MAVHTARATVKVKTPHGDVDVTQDFGYVVCDDCGEAASAGHLTVQHPEVGDVHLHAEHAGHIKAAVKNRQKVLDDEAAERERLQDAERARLEAEDAERHLTMEGEILRIQQDRDEARRRGQPDPPQAAALDDLVRLWAGGAEGG